MDMTKPYKSGSGRRRGYFYPCGTEALLNDLVHHVATGRNGIVWAVNQGGKLYVRWADVPLAAKTPGRKRYANVNVANVAFVKRNASLLKEEVAA